MTLKWDSDVNYTKAPNLGLMLEADAKVSEVFLSKTTVVGDTYAMLKMRAKERQMAAFEYSSQYTGH